MRIETIRQRLREHGAKSEHERRVLRLWAMALPQSSGRRRPEDFLPQTVRAILPALVDDLAALARLRSEHPAADGSSRLLVELADGQAVESVLLPRGGLCVSTQLGCAVGCVFCMTGREGLLRQLGSAEIVAQVALARTRRAVRKVVFMGMGEPAHNLDNVIEAAELLGTAGGIGHKSLVFSTVGDLRVFERLPRMLVRPALALSLHSTRAELRARLLPRAPRIAPAELVELGERYARSTGYPIQYQWTLLAGINDGDEEIDGIVELLRGKYALLNMIPYNTVEGLGFRRPSRERSEVIARVAAARRADQAALVGRTGCRRRLRATACARDRAAGAGRHAAQGHHTCHAEPGRSSAGPLPGPRRGPIRGPRRPVSSWGSSDGLG